MKPHIYKVHQDHKCDSCGKSFTGIGNLKNHIQTTHEEHKCEICDKSFTLSKYLKNHMTSFHQVNKVYKCEPCGKSFFEEKDLTKHIKTIHEEGSDYHSCESCGSIFTKLASLKIHKIKVHGENMFCPLCSFESVNIASLKKHILDHNKDKKCDLCDFKYATKADLTGHKRNKHPSDPENLKCRQCPFVSNGVISLRRHVILSNPQFAAAALLLHERLLAPHGSGTLLHFPKTSNLTCLLNSLA